MTGQGWIRQRSTRGDHRRGVRRKPDGLVHTSIGTSDGRDHTSELRESLRRCGDDTPVEPTGESLCED